VQTVFFNPLSSRPSSSSGSSEFNIHSMTSCLANQQEIEADRSLAGFAFQLGPDLWFLFCGSVVRLRAFIHTTMMALQCIHRSRKWLQPRSRRPSLGVDGVVLGFIVRYMIHRNVGIHKFTWPCDRILGFLLPLSTKQNTIAIRERYVGFVLGERDVP
jgi:hypothetical protein